MAFGTRGAHSPSFGLAPREQRRSRSALSRPGGEAFHKSRKIFRIFAEIDAEIGEILIAKILAVGHSC